MTTSGTRTTTPDSFTGGSLTVQLLPDAIKLRGVPPQGTGFFSVYYPVFRGRGILLSASQGGHYGMFASINNFFTATSVLYLGCEAGGTGSAAGSHIEAAVLSRSVASMEALCTDPGRGSIPSWGAALSRSLLRVTTEQKSSSVVVQKDLSKFRIEFQNSKVRDRDLIVHYPDHLFPPAPTADSADKLKSFIDTANTGLERLMIGGFYVLALPADYNGIDLLLSALLATNNNNIAYVGLIVYIDRHMQHPLWIFRCEPLNAGVVESQRSVALIRLKRYPPMLQDVVQRLMPMSSEVRDLTVSGITPVLNSLVTPTVTLGALFRQVSGPNPREVINMLANFQPKYSSTLDYVRSISNLKIQVRVIVELLYDMALAAQRRCAV